MALQLQGEEGPQVVPATLTAWNLAG